MPSIVHDVLRSPGQALDPETRTFMESRFGHDFSRVRIHTDARAAASAQAVEALAYTVGRDVVFASGQYAPGTSGGQRLLAHELTHVLQQRPTAAPANLALAPALYETEATTVAESVMAHRPHLAPRLTTHPVLAREPVSDDCCSPPRKNPCEDKKAKQLVSAVETAKKWLPQAKSAVEEYGTASSSDKAATAAGRAFKTHFNWPQEKTKSPGEGEQPFLIGEDKGPDVPGKVLTVITNTTENLKVPLCGNCPESPPETAKDSTITFADSPGSWIGTNCYNFYPDLFTQNLDLQARAVVHEMMHSWEGVWDREYESQYLDGHCSLLPRQAMNNADSYACLIRDLGKTKAKKAKK